MVEAVVALIIPLTKHREMATLDRRDRLGASAEDQSLKVFDSFADEFRHLKESWDNRLVLEKTSVAKSYLSGRLVILVRGKWPVGTDNYEWVVSIVASPAVSHCDSTGIGVYWR